MKNGIEKQNIGRLQLERNLKPRHTVTLEFLSKAGEIRVTAHRCEMKLTFRHTHTPHERSMSHLSVIKLSSGFLRLHLVKCVLKSKAAEIVEDYLHYLTKSALLQTPGVVHPMRIRHSSEPSSSINRTKDAMKPGSGCWAQRSRSANTHLNFTSVCGAMFTSLTNCAFEHSGADLPGDGGSVAMVTESASAESEGQEDRKNTTVVGSEFNV